MHDLGLELLCTIPDHQTFASEYEDSDQMRTKGPVPNHHTDPIDDQCAHASENMHLNFHGNRQLCNFSSLVQHRTSSVAREAISGPHSVCDPLHPLHLLPKTQKAMS